MAMLRPSTSAATARHLEDEEGEAEPAGARKPGPRLRTSRGLGAPRGSDGEGTGCRCARPGRRPNRAPEEAEAAAAAAAEGDDHDAITRARLRGLPRLPPAGEIRRYGWLESGVAMRTGSWHPRRLAFRFVFGSIEFPSSCFFLVRDKCITGLLYLDGIIVVVLCREDPSHSHVKWKS